MTSTQRIFTAESLREIAFPLGGIGTGTVSLGGRGQLRDWEIFNRPGKGKDLPYTFFSIYAKAEGEPGIARVLERRLLPPYSSGFGLPTGRVSGLPRMEEVLFRGEYPFAWLDFKDDSIPLQIRLEAYNPFIPMDTKNSGLPVALFNWQLYNGGSKRVTTTIAFSLLNAVGYNGTDSLSNRINAQFGQNVNEWRREENQCGIFIRSEKQTSDSPSFGTMAIVTPIANEQAAGKPQLNVTYKKRWERAGWWDDVQNFWDEFTQGEGMFPLDKEEAARELGHILPPNLSPDRQTDVGTLGINVTLEPGESVSLPFVLAWHFPNLTNTWNSEEAVKGRQLGNWYSTQWKDAWEVASYAIENSERLYSATQDYHRDFYSSTLPAEVLDAAGANASILRTTTVLRTSDGRMNAFEGCGDNAGCCPMNCTHVWNYVQTAAYLFPELERSVRLTDFQHNTRLDGSMAFRTLLPLVGELWKHPAAADGQMGTIMKVYREWLQCGDREFLESVWPGVVRSIEYAWSPGGWDADKDGVMEGEQHNTYDIEFYGPNTMCGLFYLGALRAAEEMAKALGHNKSADEYRTVFESGQKKYSDLLWNGEYFKQIVNSELWESRRPPRDSKNMPDTQLAEIEPRYQYGLGCLADQVLGQWFAHVVGLGDLLPANQTKSALAAIHRHNFRTELYNHETVQRVYALNDEGGLLLCTWPNGGRPKYPFPYADEIWTGIEYQVAAHCIYEGLIEEGLEIVRAARDRHDGAKRNPWDEFECGHHYARAMSSWSLLLAFSGYFYDASRAHLVFAPKVNVEDFQCFFSAGTAWGQFKQTRSDAASKFSLKVSWGEMTLQSLSLMIDKGKQPVVEIAGETVEASLVPGVGITFTQPVKLHAGEVLDILI